MLSFFQLWGKQIKNKQTTKQPITGKTLQGHQRFCQFDKSRVETRAKLGCSAAPPPPDGSQIEPLQMSRHIVHHSMTKS